jgi:hypothetical protein
MRLEQFDRLDVDVAIGDHDLWSVISGQFRCLLLAPGGSWFCQQLRAKS